MAVAMDMAVVAAVIVTVILAATFAVTVVVIMAMVVVVAVVVVMVVVVVVVVVVIMIAAMASGSSLACVGVGRPMQAAQYQGGSHCDSRRCQMSAAQQKKKQRYMHGGAKLLTLT